MAGAARRSAPAVETGVLVWGEAVPANPDLVQR